MLSMWDVGDVGMLGIWNVADLGCSGCGMFEIWDVGYVGCSGCGLFRMWDVGFGVFAGMWDVDLQNAHSTYVAIFPCFFFHRLIGVM